MDALGKWLELQPIVLNGTVYKLNQYPSLTGVPNGSDEATETVSPVKRTIKSIARTSAAHLSAAYQDGVEDWLIAVTLQYENDFIK